VWLHRSASLFSPYSAASRATYASVAVKYLSMAEKDSATVKVIRRASGAGAGQQYHAIDP
jgi:hypothetical protein